MARDGGMVCMKCGNRQMERDSNPGLDTPMDERERQLTETIVYLSVWGRLQEMERYQLLQTTQLVSAETLADYEKFKMWWNDLGSENRNNIKRAAAQYSQMLQMV